MNQTRRRILVEQLQPGMIVDWHGIAYTYTHTVIPARYFLIELLEIQKETTYQSEGHLWSVFHIGRNHVGNMASNVWHIRFAKQNIFDVVVEGLLDEHHQI